MKRLILFVCVSGAWAQVPPTTSFYGAGAQYNSGSPTGTSAGGSWAAFAWQVSKSTNLWQFNMYTTNLIKPVGGGRTEIVSNPAAGMAVKVGPPQMGPISIYAFGTIGVGTSGTNVGNTFPYGGFVDWSIPSSKWHLDVGYMQIPSSLPGVQTQKAILLGFLRSL